MVNFLSCGVRVRAHRSFFHFVTHHAFDKQSDKHTDRQNPHRWTARSKKEADKKRL